MRRAGLKGLWRATASGPREIAFFQSKKGSAAKQKKGWDPKKSQYDSAQASFKNDS